MNPDHGDDIDQAPWKAEGIIDVFCTDLRWN